MNTTILDRNVFFGSNYYKINYYYVNRLMALIDTINSINIVSSINHCINCIFMVLAKFRKYLGYLLCQLLVVSVFFLVDVISCPSEENPSGNDFLFQ